MSESQPLWDEVARNFESQAHRLEARYDENVDRAELDRTMQTFGETLHQSLSAIGDAARDPAVRDDVDRLTTSLGDALAKTVTAIGKDVREALAPRTDRHREIDSP